MMFGTQEHLDCIVDVTLKLHDQPLCLAHKTSMKFFIGGLYAKDDGYVLKVQGKESYYQLPPEPLRRELQARGELPSPLPAYSIGFAEYFLGYSLWWAIGLVAVLGAVKQQRTRRRQAATLARPPTLGPPVLRTVTDRYISEQAYALLEPGETVQHQAYALDRPVDSMTAGFKVNAFFAVLTDRRLLLLKTRAGAFAPLCENHGVEVIQRNAVARAGSEENALLLQLHDGSGRGLWVRDSRHLSNQKAFREDVPRLLAARASQESARPS